MADGPRATRHPPPEQINWGGLSDRSAETIAEIATLVAAGFNYAEIAQRHGRSEAWCAMKMAQLRREIVALSEASASGEH
jgi:hypothetical protein